MHCWLRARSSAKLFNDPSLHENFLVLKFMITSKFEDSRKKFFTQKAVRHCNRLPREVLDTLTLEAFKASLDELRGASAGGWQPCPQHEVGTG